MRRAPGLCPRDVRGCPRMSADVRGLLGPSIGLCLTEHVRAAKTMCSAGGYTCRARFFMPGSLLWIPIPSTPNPATRTQAEQTVETLQCHNCRLSKEVSQRRQHGLRFLRRTCENVQRAVANMGCENHHSWQTDGDRTKYNFVKT